MNDKKIMNRAADNIRILAASMVEKANSGHPGGAMGGADFINVLFSEFLVWDPDNLEWEGRDRFFLDPGHMSPMLYSALALQGKFTLDELKRTWMARLNENCMFISAKEKENIDEFRETIYKKVRELHVQKYPYNDFLYEVE